MSEPIASQLDTLEDILEFDRTPYLQRYPVQNAYDLIMESSLRFGDDLALTFLPTAAKDEIGIDVSYQQLGQRVTQTANLLSELGVGKKDTVAILLPMLPATHFALWGSAAAAIAAPINPFLEARFIAEIINATGAKVLVTLAPEWDTDLWEDIHFTLPQN